VDPGEIRAECRRLLVQEMEYEGRVHPSEEAIESWVEAGFEVRVVGRKRLGVHFTVCYTDNVMVITSANLTGAGLDRLRECGEVVVSMVSDLKAPVGILESDPFGFATVTSANVHASVLYEFLTEPDRVYGDRLPEHGGLKRLYRDLRKALRRYLREGCPSMLWWLGPEPGTTSGTTP
jgi:hypothetical protein